MKDTVAWDRCRDMQCQTDKYFSSQKFLVPNILLLKIQSVLALHKEGGYPNVTYG
jgi:hypothetical protein